MRIRLVFASNNPHKLAEIAAQLGDRYELLGLKDIGCEVDIPETGQTLEENAVIKARYVHEHFGYDCFADDTGLEVNALSGEPGVYSARYAGEDKDPEKNMDKVLRSLSGSKDRSARFRTVICLIEDGEAKLFEGIVNGLILQERQGTEGFGYDPIFQPEGESRSFAEMSKEEKNTMSHRGRAVAKLVDYLRSDLAD